MGKGVRGALGELGIHVSLYISAYQIGPINSIPSIPIDTIKIRVIMGRNCQTGFRIGARARGMSPGVFAPPTVLEKEGVAHEADFRKVYRCAAVSFPFF